MRVRSEGEAQTRTLSQTFMFGFTIPAITEEKCAIQHINRETFYYLSPQNNTIQKIHKKHKKNQLKNPQKNPSTNKQKLI